MLSAFRDKKGFSVLFSKQQVEQTATAPVLKAAATRRSDSTHLSLPTHGRIAAFDDSPMVSVSPDSEIVELGAKRRSTKSAVTVNGSATPRHTLRSRLSSLELSSGKKKMNRSTSGMYTPRSVQGIQSGRGTTTTTPTAAILTSRQSGGGRLSGNLASTPPMPASSQYQQVKGIQLPPSGADLSGTPQHRASIGSGLRTPRSATRTSGLRRTSGATSILSGMHGSTTPPQSRVASTAGSAALLHHRSAFPDGSLAFKRTHSNTAQFARTASGTRRLTRQATATPSNRFGRMPSSTIVSANYHSFAATTPTGGAHPNSGSLHPLTRTASATKLTRIASANCNFTRMKSDNVGTFGRSRSNYAPFTRLRSATAGGYSAGYAHYTPYARSRSANVGAYTRTPTTAPSRLKRSRSTNAAFVRTPTGGGGTRKPNSAAMVSPRVGTPLMRTPSRTVTPVQRSRGAITPRHGTPLQRTATAAMCTSGAPTQHAAPAAATSRFERNVSRTHFDAVAALHPQYMTHHTVTTPPRGGAQTAAPPTLLHVTTRKRRAAVLTPPSTPSGVSHMPSSGGVTQRKTPRPAVLTTPRPVLSTTNNTPKTPTLSCTNATSRTRKPRSSVGDTSPAGSKMASPVIDTLHVKSSSSAAAPAKRKTPTSSHLHSPATSDVFARLTTPRRAVPARTSPAAQQHLTRTDKH